MNEVVLLNMSRVEIEETVARVVRAEVEKALTRLSSRQPKEYLSPDEVCAQYNLSKSTLYKLTASRALASIKSGKRLLVSRTDLENYMQAHRRLSLEELSS